MPSRRLSSAVGLYMLAADGEGGAEVYSLATTRDQARIVFGDAQTMARLQPGISQPVLGERRGAQHARDGRRAPSSKRSRLKARPWTV